MADNLDDLMSSMANFSVIDAPPRRAAEPVPGPVTVEPAEAAQPADEPVAVPEPDESDAEPDFVDEPDFTEPDETDIEPSEPVMEEPDEVPDAEPDDGPDENADNAVVEPAAANVTDAKPEPAGDRAASSAASDTVSSIPPVDPTVAQAGATGQPDHQDATLLMRASGQEITLTDEDKITLNRFPTQLVDMLRQMLTKVEDPEWVKRESATRIVTGFCIAMLGVTLENSNPETDRMIKAFSGLEPVLAAVRGNTARIDMANRNMSVMMRELKELHATLDVLEVGQTFLVANTIGEAPVVNATPSTIDVVSKKSLTTIRDRIRQQTKTLAQAYRKSTGRPIR